MKTTGKSTIMMMCLGVALFALTLVTAVNAACDVSGNIGEGQTQNFALGGVNHEITLVFVSNPDSQGTVYGKFQVDNQLTNSLTAGDSQTLTNGVGISVQGVQTNDSTGAASFCLSSAGNAGSTPGVTTATTPTTDSTQRWYGQWGPGEYKMLSGDTITFAINGVAWKVTPSIVNGMNGQSAKFSINGYQAYTSISVGQSYTTADGLTIKVNNIISQPDGIYIDFTASVMTGGSGGSNIDQTAPPVISTPPTQGICSYNGQSYTAGASFTANDGCNACTCRTDGSVVCTMRACAIPPATPPVVQHCSSDADCSQTAAQPMVCQNGVCTQSQLPVALPPTSAWDITGTLGLGQTQTYTKDGQSAEITPVFISNPVAGSTASANIASAGTKIMVNGELSPLLSAGQEYGFKAGRLRVTSVHPEIKVDATTNSDPNLRIALPPPASVSFQFDFSQGVQSGSDIYRLGESRTVTLDGKDYEVSVIFISDGGNGVAGSNANGQSAKIMVNNIVSDSIAKGQSATVNGLAVTVLDIGADSNSQWVRLSFGPQGNSGALTCQNQDCANFNIPVCAWVESSSTVTMRTYASACDACKDTDVKSFRPGACAQDAGDGTTNPILPATCSSDSDCAVVPGYRCEDVPNANGVTKMCIHDSVSDTVNPIPTNPGTGAQTDGQNPLPPVQQCSGCIIDGKCVPIGTRVADGEAKYCDLNGIGVQKADNSTCQNNYECASNQCYNAVCVSLEKDVQQQTNLLQRIASWFSRIFGG